MKLVFIVLAEFVSWFSVPFVIFLGRTGSETEEGFGSPAVDGFFVAARMLFVGRILGHEI